MNPRDPRRPALQMAGDVSRTGGFPLAVPPGFLAAELAEIRQHLTILCRHTDRLERQMAEIRGGRPSNVRPIRPA